MRYLLISLITLQVALGSTIEIGGAATLQGSGGETFIGHSRPCDLALDSCKDVISAQDASINQLKQAINTLEDKLADATKPAIIPTWMLITMGVLTGAVAASILHK